ncbi:MULTISPECIES: OprO/OprP family phosphate-selective porin [unclassified Pseudomonas]|uniref:OprO/OprP family phosphate-selective porin n=1 Tax=unclassified Pseudomonas TaxID=196821 RepID=UPI000DA95CF2|nr:MULTISPECIES: porin [unclassified Pseudomonas]MDW3711815.1 porin [Pseudomonas sp. 2023EL-01195]PZE13977.1 porin [Pseudomonas sp. 57B-090624]
MIRKHFAGFAASAMALAISAQAFAGTVTTDGTDIVIKTKGGLEVATTDKSFAFKLGGRLQADYGRFDGLYTRNGDTGDAAYFRRAYLELSGIAYTDWAYAVAYDFSENSGNSSGAANSGNFDEASISYTGFNPITIRVGRFDPDFGLEKATSSKWVTALERNAMNEVIDWANTHQDGLGVQVQALISNYGYVSTSLTSKDANDDEGDSVKQFNARGVFAPMAEAGNVLHFGVNFAQRKLDDVAGADVRYRSRLGMRGVDTNGGNASGNLGNRAVLAGTNSATSFWDDDTAFGLEAAFASGPFSIQGEWMKRETDSAGAQSDLEADGFYVQAAYTLTGEARGYKMGKFDAIKPANKQTGAWEIYYRYDSISADNDVAVLAAANQTFLRGAEDTEAKVHNIGVNWYANEAVKISGMYTKAKTDHFTNRVGDDSGDGFVVRAQYVF